MTARDLLCAGCRKKFHDERLFGKAVYLCKGPALDRRQFAKRLKAGISKAKLANEFGVTLRRAQQIAAEMRGR